MSTPPAVPEPTAVPSVPGGRVGAIIRAAPLAAALYTPVPGPPVTTAARGPAGRADRAPGPDGRDR